MRKNGFTLIELLVTISILAVLSTIGMLMYQGVLSKARDAARKNDLNKLASALEIYYQEKNKYPDNNSFSAEIAPKLSDNIVPKDPQNNPQDPQSHPNYYYTGTDSAFTLCAKLEIPDLSIPTPPTCPSPLYNYGVIPK